MNVYINEGVYIYIVYSVVLRIFVGKRGRRVVMGVLRVIMLGLLESFSRIFRKRG